jgi:hypothetical protein
MKKEWWDLSEEIRRPIMAELEQKFGLLFDKLRVMHTWEIVNKTVKPVAVQKEIPESIRKEL